MEKEAAPQFLDFLSQRGWKFTPQREKVLQEAFDAEGHFEAEELLQRFRRKGWPASRATVYRTLSLLVKAGLLKEVIHGGKHHHYEPVHEEERHDHLICVKCGRILEFKNRSLREIEKTVCEQNQFQPQKILIDIFGLCQRCR